MQNIFPNTEKIIKLSM